MFGCEKRLSAFKALEIGRQGKQLRAQRPQETKIDQNDKNRLKDRVHESNGVRMTPVPGERLLCANPHS